MRYFFYTPELLKQIPKVCGIYKITCLVNNKFYDGKAVNVRGRARDHIRESENSLRKSSYNMPIHKAFRKYGIENFVIEILEECKKEDLDKLEKYYIALHNSKDRNIGYNVADGGNGGRLNTKITETQAYLIKELIPFGYTATEAYSLFKEAYSEANLTRDGFINIYLGRRYFEINKEVFNISDEEKSINRFKRTTGIDISEIITLRSSGISKTEIYNKYINNIPIDILIYLIDYGEIPKINCKITDMKKVKRIDPITGESIIFSSTRAAERITNIHSSSISRCCQKHGLVGGYKWEYVD